MTDRYLGRINTGDYAIYWAIMRKLAYVQNRIPPSPPVPAVPTS